MLKGDSSLLLGVGLLFSVWAIIPVDNNNIKLPTLIVGGQGRQTEQENTIRQIIIEFLNKIPILASIITQTVHQCSYPGSTLTHCPYSHTTQVE